jgi:P2-related tail formation protein
MPLSAIILLPSLAVAAAVPPWLPTYEMKRSTIAMPCNMSGYFNATALAQYG